jgi:hypothetical protein
VAIIVLRPQPLEIAMYGEQYDALEEDLRAAGQRNRKNSGAREGFLKPLRSAYTYFHLPIIAGIIAVAASDDLVVADPAMDGTQASIAFALGGTALFLAGHLPASLMFILVSRRYERASLIVTSNKPFSAWGEIFGDDMAAVAMADRLIHHAELISLKGDSYRLRDRDLGPRPTRPGDTA